jgi:hypothetical protein
MTLIDSSYSAPQAKVSPSPDLSGNDLDNGGVVGSENPGNLSIKNNATL